jgi:hypothetical protein
VTCQACDPGKISLDRTTCVTAMPWPNGTPLPDGTLIAIRLRQATTYQNLFNSNSNPVPRQRWIGLSAMGDSNIDAYDVALTSSDLFAVTFFQPANGWPEAYGDLGWFNLRASNGQYVARNHAYAMLSAWYELPDAGIFSRGPKPWNQDNFAVDFNPWSQAQAWIDEFAVQHDYYTGCETAVIYTGDHIGAWVSNSGWPNYGCDQGWGVDYYIVTP